MDAFSNLGRVVATILLILVNGFFVAAEFALVKVRETQLHPLIRAGNRRARLGHRILGKVDPYLGACQLGITLASIALGILGEPAMEALLDPLIQALGIRAPEVRHAVAFSAGYAVITFLHIVVGEQAPKFLALKQALPMTLWASYPLHWFYVVSYPFIWVVNAASMWLLGRLGIEQHEVHGGQHSEEELRLMLHDRARSASEGGLGRNIALNAFDLRRRVVRDVMRPRNEIVALSTGATMQECLEVAERSRYSRFPLCEGGNLDQTAGVVHFKDLMAQRAEARMGSDLKGVARRLIYVPETARLERLLGLFLERRLHFAVVVDEYGGTAGVVTLENCLEELVGQIQDEHDQERPRMIQRSEHEWELDGSLPLHEAAALMGQPLSGEGVTTVGGWVMKRLGGFPKRGDVVASGRCELRIEELAGLRVTRLGLRRSPAPSGSDTALFSRGGSAGSGQH